jgi:hypothetical protein
MRHKGRSRCASTIHPLQSICTPWHSEHRYLAVSPQEHKPSWPMGPSRVTSTRKYASRKFSTQCRRLESWRQRSGTKKSSPQGIAHRCCIPFSFPRTQQLSRNYVLRGQVLPLVAVVLICKARRRLGSEATLVLILQLNILHICAASICRQIPCTSLRRTSISEGMTERLKRENIPPFPEVAKRTPRLVFAHQPRSRTARPPCPLGRVGDEREREGRERYADGGEERRYVTRKTRRCERG